MPPQFWTGVGEEENGQPAQCGDLKTGGERKTWAGSPPPSLKLNASWVTYFSYGHGANTT